MSKFTLRYPLAVGSHGGLARDTTSQSRIRILSTVVKRQFAVNPRYGFPPFGFEQGSLEPDAEQLLIEFFTKRALLEWVPSIGVIAVASMRDREAMKRILRILFIDRAGGADPRQQMLMPVGLDFLPEGA